jgi:hypothetical protein
VVVAVLLVVARPRPTALLPPRSNGKPEAGTAVIELLIMGMRMPETCWAILKRQVTNLRNCCMWLVVSFECMMMHGLANPKLICFCMQIQFWNSLKECFSLNRDTKCSVITLNKLKHCHHQPHSIVMWLVIKHDWMG